MAKEAHKLLAAFHEDHAVLGRGFHELSQCLRTSDLAKGRQIARRLDDAGGAHIAFEERHFYPLLEPLIGAEEVRQMHEAHGKGLSVVHTLLEREEGSPLSEAERQGLLERSEAMEQHIAECGELFEAIGRMSGEEQDALYGHLVTLREERTRWTEFADAAVSRDTAG